jgi:electron transport complex protein RnfA
LAFSGSPFWGVPSVWLRPNYAVYEKPDPDILLTITNVMLSPDMRRVTLTFDSELNQLQPHIVTVKEIMSEGRSQGTGVMTAKKIYFGYLLSILIGAMIIKNFVFTKYLGLCVFFGTSQKKSTAIGMGITFTIVALFSAVMSWFLYQYVLKPYRLDFLQIVVFIGLVSLSVQAVDTILRKLNPVLFNAFGVYLVLVIANCIILAVPLTLASNEYNAWESLMLAMGAGLGFLIALFLMASVREKLELANVPPTYRGLPIAFIVAGLFALAFMGFSGMAIF